MARTFVDTSILVCAYDLDAGQKRATAASVLAVLWEEGSGTLSDQVLHEFYATVTRRIPTPLSKLVARSVIKDYIPWCTETGPDDISVAFQMEDQYGWNFWDALIMAAAAKSGAVRILSEDLKAGQRYDGLVVENPFAGARP